MNAPIKALGAMLVASARKPKVWTKRELFTVTTGELDAMPMADQHSYTMALFAHWQGRDIDQEQRIADRQVRIDRLQDGLQEECQKDHDEEREGTVR